MLKRSIQAQFLVLIAASRVFGVLSTVSSLLALP